MRRYKQSSPEWGHVNLNGTPKTVKTSMSAIGCLVCSICSLHSRWYPKNPLRPDEGARTFKFTRTGLLKWHDTDFPGMKFLSRLYGYPKKTIKGYVKAGLGVVVQVDNFHWLAVYGWSIWGQPVLFDPVDGHILWFPFRRYKAITGAAIFQQT